MVVVVVVVMVIVVIVVKVRIVIIKVRISKQSDPSSMLLTQFLIVEASHKVEKPPIIVACYQT